MLKGDWLRNSFNYLKDAVFPLFCLACGLEGKILCKECLPTLCSQGVFACPVCHLLCTQGKCCAGCASLSALDQVASVAPYFEAEILGQLIQAFKYEYVTETHAVIQTIINNFLARDVSVFSSVDLIIPVPLHPRRLAERGFNQAAIIARMTADSLGKRYVPALKRPKWTKQQARLNKTDRQKNVRSAFAISPRSDVRGLVCLLVDDVFTTGSTMQECARVLKADGAREVLGFTLARG